MAHNFPNQSFVGAPSVDLYDLGSGFIPYRFKGRHSPYLRSLSSSPITSILKVSVMDAAFSPPLSEFELREIRESEREFKAGKSRKFDTPDAAIEFLKTI